ncbi:bromodomain-containing protein, partial [Cystoisospora suis]
MTFNPRNDEECGWLHEVALKKKEKFLEKWKRWSPKVFAAYRQQQSLLSASSSGVQTPHHGPPLQPSRRCSSGEILHWMWCASSHEDDGKKRCSPLSSQILSSLHLLHEVKEPPWILHSLCHENKKNKLSHSLSYLLLLLLASLSSFLLLILLLLLASCCSFLLLSCLSSLSYRQVSLAEWSFVSSISKASAPSSSSNRDSLIFAWSPSSLSSARREEEEKEGEEEEAKKLLESPAPRPSPRAAEWRESKARPSCRDNRPKKRKERKTI